MRSESRSRSSELNRAFDASDHSHAAKAVAHAKALKIVNR